jgi:uncharacterized protein YbaA (DUF1428 family)
MLLRFFSCAGQTMMADDFNDERMDWEKLPTPFDDKRCILGGFRAMVEL